MKLHQVLDGLLELIPYRPEHITSSNETEYRYKLALYLVEIGVIDGVMAKSSLFKEHYLFLLEKSYLFSFTETQITRVYNKSIPASVYHYLILLYSGEESEELVREFYEYLDCFPPGKIPLYLANIIIPPLAKYMSRYICDRYRKKIFPEDQLINYLNEVYFINNCVVRMGIIIELKKYNYYRLVASYHMLVAAHYLGKEYLDDVIKYYNDNGRSIEELLIRYIGGDVWIKDTTISYIYLTMM